VGTNPIFWAAIFPKRFVDALNNRSVECDKLEVARLLLEAGAQINTVDHYGKTPLDWAREGGLPIVERILEDAEKAQSKL
jgi:ankyrin repeat protein